MLQKISAGITRFPEIKVRPAELHKVRGYFSTQYKQYDLLHNHDKETGKLIYRYPAIQFKISDCFAIFGYKQEGIEILKEIFLTAEDIMIEGRKIAIHGKEIEVKEEWFGEDGQFYVYEFITPWIALNQVNFREYKFLGDEEGKSRMLNSILINNIISFCKFAGYTVRSRLEVKSKFHEVEVNLKGTAHRAFRGEFMVNFLLPGRIGLGKSSSRGYGSIVKKM
jgi:hypothetical protein